MSPLSAQSKSLEHPPPFSRKMKVQKSRCSEDFFSGPPCQAEATDVLEMMVIVINPCSLTQRHKINDFVDWRWLKHVCREAGKCYVARSKLVATLLSGVSSVQSREGSAGR